MFTGRSGIVTGCRVQNFVVCDVLVLMETTRGTEKVCVICQEDVKGEDSIGKVICVEVPCPVLLESDF